MSEKSKSTGGKCVSENSTNGKPGETRTSHNPFEVSRSEKSQYFVDVVKDNTFLCVSHTNTYKLFFVSQYIRGTVTLTGPHTLTKI